MLRAEVAALRGRRATSSRTAVGYVELPGEVRVETRLTEVDPERARIGMPMELTLIPAPGDSGALTFAFRPEAPA